MIEWFTWHVDDQENDEMEPQGNEHMVNWNAGMLVCCGIDH